MPEDKPNGLDQRVGGAETVRDIFEAMPIMLLGMAGPEHEVVAVNATYRLAAGRGPLVGRPVFDLFPATTGRHLSGVLDQVYASGVAQVSRGWHVQVERNGGRLDDVYLDFTISPRWDADGVVIGLSLFGTDTTQQMLERQRAQRDAAEAKLRYEQARDVITALQRQLLPSGLPVLPSVRIAGSYLLADTEDAAGGDWFDAVPVRDGRVALVVGDVVGHGVSASAAMGQLRAVLHERLDDTGDILTAIGAVDRMARRVTGAHAATVCVAVLDPADGTLTYCSAGHPAPLVVNTGVPRYLPASGSGPLGTGADYTVGRDRLDPGEVVLLYSDGVIERPGRDLAAATAELSDAVINAVAGRGFDDSGLSAVDRVCAFSLETLVRLTGHTDDITLLAAQCLPPPTTLRLRLPAEPDMIRTVRDELRRWLHECGAGDRDVDDLAHAVTELVTNAVEHSHPATVEGTVTVTAELGADGDVRVGVADDGHWQERTRDERLHRGRGLGLAMATRFVDDLDVDRGEHGTIATARRRLSHPARLLTADDLDNGDPRRPAAELPELMLILEQPHAPRSRIAVYGALDTTNTGQLTAELDRLTLGGTHELTVDLTAVTHLASAAVAALLRANAPGENRTPPLRLYAPPGSIAHQVLTLVDLPHATTDPDGQPT